MPAKIKVAILDDHQSIIDGYLHRLSTIPAIEVVATAAFGEELEPMLAHHAVDVLLLDVTVPISADDPNPYPILHLIPKLVQHYPALHVLVISMHHPRALIKAVMEAGASGYIIKDDGVTIRSLGTVIQTVAEGGIHFSQQALREMLKGQPETVELTGRQLEALSLCSAFPDVETAELARRLGVAHSTLRNLLSTAYTKLDVRTRTAAILKARQMGLITPLEPVVAETAR